MAIVFKHMISEAGHTMAEKTYFRLWTNGEGQERRTLKRSTVTQLLGYTAVVTLCSFLALR